MILVLTTLLGLFKLSTVGETPRIVAARDLESFVPREAAANRTLGVSRFVRICPRYTDTRDQFEKILALSPGPSWRTRGLDLAAKLVGLEFTYVPQPQNTEELITAFSEIGKAEGTLTPLHGSAKAWLAHTDLLKYFIMSGLESALIVEDDVDFDVDLKSQMRLLSDNVRAYTNVSFSDRTPYGNAWDILWLGHCGSTVLRENPGLRYLDPSRCKTALYSGWSKHFLRDYLQEGYRIIHWAQRQTVCTFAFAIHKGSAQKILDIASKGADQAYDVALSRACWAGTLKCLIVNPQIMNHYEPLESDGYMSPVGVGDGVAAALEESKWEKKMGATGNIMKSARCQTLFKKTCLSTLR